MEKPLANQPVLDEASLRKQASVWQSLRGVPGSAGRVVVEWGVGRGPNCFVYPAASRAAGLHLTQGHGTDESDERWADFLEFQFVPQVIAALEAEGLKPQVICVDLRPVQVMRARRRAIEKSAQAKTGATH